MVASKQNTKGRGYNQTNKKALKTNKHKPTKGNKTCEAWQGCKKEDLHIQARTKTQKHRKSANKAEIRKKELIETFIVLECMYIGLDH